jgi:acyl carrier protein
MDRVELQTALAAIWAEVLRVDSVGPDQDFFSLGGNSLLAVRMIGLVHERIGTDVPAQRLMKSRTVAELAQAMAEGADPADEEEGVI